MKFHSFYFFGILFLLSCTNTSDNQVPSNQQKDLSMYQKAYFASGCFWCVEAIFEEVVGVEEAISGYSGGKEINPTYKEVSSGKTGHAEAVEIYYDSSKITYKNLLVVFFGSHDPTTVNRQGPDSGPQYRSIIFYQNETEKKLANEYIIELKNQNAFKNSIVTEVIPLEIFYKAEDYHQNYEKNNPDNSYIQNVSIPRLNKFKRKHPQLLK